MILDKFDPRDGGMYRYLHEDKDGSQYGFHGVFHEVTAPERIIQTFEFEGLPERGHVVFETLKLEELPGNRTRIIAQAVYQSVEDRDGQLQSGMEEGARESYDRLSELVEKLKIQA
jgi:uncharacterized protein YndB with AHSA1/START domain